MKFVKYFKYIGFLLVCILIPSSVVANSGVLPPTIELIGDAKELSFTESNEPGFLHESTFLPGNSIERTLIIRNEKNVSFRLSFELERTAAKPSDVDLLSKINIQIYEGDKLLCTGIIDENNCDNRQFYATLNPGDVRELRMIATFNEDAGNEYKNKKDQYDWIFDAVVATVPSTGKPTVPTLIPTTGNPLVDTGLFALEIVVLGGALLIGSQYLLKRKK